MVNIEINHINNLFGTLSNFSKYKKGPETTMFQDCCSIVFNVKGGFIEIFKYLFKVCDYLILFLCSWLKITYRLQKIQASFIREHFYSLYCDIVYWYIVLE